MCFSDLLHLPATKAQESLLLTQECVKQAIRQNHPRENCGANVTFYSLQPITSGIYHLPLTSIPTTYTPLLLHHTCHKVTVQKDKHTTSLRSVCVCKCSISLFFIQSQTGLRSWVSPVYPSTSLSVTSTILSHWHWNPIHQDTKPLMASFPMLVWVTLRLKH